MWERLRSCFGHAVNQGRAGVLSLYATHQNAA